MNGIKSLVIVVILISISPFKAVAFHEGWERSPEGVYIPYTPYIIGDEGPWALDDTICTDPEYCGVTESPNRAEIFSKDGSHVLRLTSNWTYDGCADNVWIVKPWLSIPITRDTFISFEETGELDAPELGGVPFCESQDLIQPALYYNCYWPPCFDNIALILDDNRGNRLLYVLQGPVGASPNPCYSFYREIFLNPIAGTYKRNLFDDFSSIPDFNPDGAEVAFIEFAIDEHGWGEIDNIVIGTNGGTDTDDDDVGAMPWIPLLLLDD